MNRNEGGAMEDGAREFERRVGALLVQSADDLDGRTRSALTQARFAALAQAQSAGPARRALRFSWAPAGALAMALMVVVFHAGQRTGDVPAAVHGADDFALISDADLFDLSNDGDMDLDSDFYEWAAAAGGMPGDGLRS